MNKSKEQEYNHNNSQLREFAKEYYGLRKAKYTREQALNILEKKYDI